jgi:cytochrome c oxidase subunit II
MINKRHFSAIAIMAALALCLTGTARSAQDSTTPRVREFTMTAKSYEFDPNVITVKKGDTVRLIVTAIDRVHGIKIDGYDINQELKKGDPATIEFTADKAGTFEFRCSVPCGVGHRKMKGKLVVEE